jgi:nitrite reductase (NADH) small subunit
MPRFVRVAAVSDLLPGRCMEVLADGRPVALFNVAGNFHALTNTCAHRGGPLGQGVMDGPTVICPWHAWSFDVTTGVSTVNETLSVRRYEVRVENGDVLVGVDEPSA